MITIVIMDEYALSLTFDFIMLDKMFSQSKPKSANCLWSANIRKIVCPRKSGRGKLAVRTKFIKFAVMNLNLSEGDWLAGPLARKMRAVLAPIYGDGEAKAMTSLIFHHLKGWSPTDMIINADRPVSDYVVDKIDAILSRLEAGEPLQYILGEARFYGLDLKVSPAVLIPRPETEELVDLIVRENRADDLRVLDVGTGSGAIAIALSRNLPFSRVTAIDISPAALEIARENAKTLHARIDFREQDVFTYEPPASAFDIIVSNPPYIAEAERKDMERNVLDHEPAAALFVPDDNPLIYYSRIAGTGTRALVPGGRLYFEINPLFAESLRAMLLSEGYGNVRISEDISHRKRFAVAVKPVEQ